MIRLWMKTIHYLNKIRSHLVIIVPMAPFTLKLISKLRSALHHGILLHKVKELGITGKLGQWFYHFLTNRKHFVRLPGGVSCDHPVISGVPQGTVLGPLLFIIMIADINKDIACSKLISFADDTRVNNEISDTEDCDSLQRDLNSVYKWASDNNMFFNAQKNSLFTS